MSFICWAKYFCLLIKPTKIHSFLPNKKTTTTCTLGCVFDQYCIPNDALLLHIWIKLNLRPAQTLKVEARVTKPDVGTKCIKSSANAGFNLIAQ